MLARAFDRNSSRQGATDSKTAIHNKIKSASLDINNTVAGVAGGNYSGCERGASSKDASCTCQDTSPKSKQGNTGDTIVSNRSGKNPANNAKLKSSSNSSLHQKAKSFLSLSSGPLKPSSSTSCLFTDDDDSESTRSGSASLINTPTRASLTHEWKKLKTPNKCRECNLLVYFNGRECSFCGFVAHKKCVTVLVIKCSGQQVQEAKSTTKSKSQQQLLASPVDTRSRAAQLFGMSRLSFAISATNLTDTAGCDKLPSSKTLKDQNQLQHNGKAAKSFQQLIRPIFGQPIESDSFQLIDFIKRFIYEIDTRGLTSKGIYRVSSIKSKVDKLCNYYDQNLSSLIDLSSFHPNIIANALKMYLRQLPEPLLTHRLYQDFIVLAKNYPSPRPNSRTPSPIPDLGADLNNRQTSYRPTESVNELATDATSSTANNQYDPMLIVDTKEIVDMLPPINRELVGLIMRHLKRVSDMSGVNQMSARNLSIIFGPTLLTASDKSLAIADNIHQARVVELMIQWADQIFPLYTNYESKAVIELDLSRHRKYSNSKSRRSKSRPNVLNLNYAELTSDGQVSQRPALEIPVVDVTPDTDEIIRISFSKLQPEINSSSSNVSRYANHDLNDNANKDAHA